MPSCFCSMFLLIIALSLLLLLPNCEGRCGGDGWTHWAGGRKCVKVFPERTGWTVAEFNCAYQGSHQISVQDIRENQFFADLAKDYGQIWLGAAQFGPSTNYVWSDGKPFAFERWKGGKRPSYHRGKKCTKMEAVSGEWLQSCCKMSAAYICQKPVPILTGNVEEQKQMKASKEFSRWQ